MSIFAYSILACLAVAATGFACWPILKSHGSGRARALLASAAAALVLGIGGGCYLMLGAPQLAARSFAQPSPGDLPGLIATLAKRVRERPQYPKGWVLLGRGYLTLSDPVDAAAAFKRAINVTPPPERGPLYSAYGEALTLAAQGAVTDEAEAAFKDALMSQPRDFAARYYLGLAYASRRDAPHALVMWQSLLADAPPEAPWRAELVDRIAALTSSTGVTPDVNRMVATLAERLRRQPRDLHGWERLIRAYAVLGQPAEAREALAHARQTFAKEAAAGAELGRTAKSLGLE